MQIIHLSDRLLSSGREAFRQYMLAVTCGAGSPTYDELIFRALGIEVVPGAILGCIEHGVTRRADIVRAVCRVSHCRDDTVAAVLDAFEGSDPAFRLWTHSGDRYSAAPAGRTGRAGGVPSLIAA